MKEAIDLAIKKLDNAISRLKGGIETTKDELDKDGVIQRFEFTYELLWKALKIYLEREGVEVKTPRENFKEAFRIGLIDDEDIFLDLIEDRNRTSHTYDKAVSEEIFMEARTLYASESNQAGERYN